MGLIQDLCTHSIYLKNGNIEQYGLTSDVLPDYLREGADNQPVWDAVDEKSILRQVSLLNKQGQLTSSFAYDETAIVSIDYTPDRKNADFVLAVRVTDELGRDIFTSWDTDSTERKSVIGLQANIACHLTSKLLRPGRYYLTVLARKAMHGYIETIEEAALQFEVSNIGFIMNSDRFGVVLPELEWHEEIS